MAHSVYRSVYRSVSHSVPRFSHVQFMCIVSLGNNIKGSLKMDTASPDTIVKFNALIQSNLELLQTTYQHVYFSIELGDLLPTEKVLSSNQIKDMKQLLYASYQIH